MTDKQIKNIYEFKRQGMTNKEIAGLIGASTEAVKKHLQRHPVEEPSVCRCEQCGEVITPFNDGRSKRFCSPKCRNNYWNKHRKVIGRKSTKQCECEECHKPFLTYGRPRRFCSRACFQINESRKWGDKSK